MFSKRTAPLSPVTKYKVEIHGALADIFCERLDAAVTTPEEVLRLLEANRPGTLNAWFRTGDYVMYRGHGDDLTLVTQQTIRKPLTRGECVHVTPVIAGGIFDVVLGVIAIITSVISIVLAFIYAPPDDLASDAVSPQGDINVDRAGAIVPVGYGRTRTRGRNGTGPLTVSSERAVGRFTMRAAETNTPDPYLVSQADLARFIDSGELNVPSTAQTRLRTGATRTRLIFALCEGPITEVEQVLFDGTGDIEDNPGVGIENTFGFDPQFFRRNFETSSTPVAVGAILSPTRQVETLSTDTDIASLILQITSFFEIPRGKSRPRATVVQLIVERREVGTTEWEEVARPAITEESFEEKLFGLDIELDRERRWQIAVRRADEETQTDKLQDRVTWTTVNEIRFNRASYDGTAVSIIEYTDESFGGNNPEIEFIGRWRRLRIPSNYDPVTRTYTGVWDGTYKGLRDFSNNTALVIQDILENNVFGLGDYLDGRFDRFQLFALAQYCDGMVDDGQGGQEPRFTFNGFLNEGREAMVVLRDVASSLRGQAFWDGSQVQIIADQPRSVTHIAVSANIEGGDFGYTGPAIEAVPNSIKVSYLDQNNNFEPDEVLFQDEEAVAEFGLVEREVEGVGITSPAQALRLARYIGLAQGRLVSFTGTEYYADVVPGDLVQVHDSDFMGTRRGGLVVSATTTQVVLDGDTTTLDSGTVPTGTSTLTCVLPNGLVQTREITAISAVTAGVQVTVSPAFAAVPQAQSPWGVTTTALNPQFFVVQSREDLGDGRYRISGVEYDPNRLTQAETGIAVDDRPPITDEPTNFAARPRNLGLRLLQVPEPVGFRQDIIVTWLAPPQVGSGAIVSYQVFLARDGGPREFQGSTDSTSFRINDVEEGSYSVFVRAVAENAVSPFAGAQITVEDAAEETFGVITGLELFGQGTDTDFQGTDARFTWRFQAPQDIQDIGFERFGADSAFPSDLLRGFTVRIIDNETNEIVREVPNIRVNEYTYTLQDNVDDGLGTPRRTFTIEVFAVDRFNNLSVPAELTVTNPPPAVPTGITVTGGIGQFIVTFTPDTSTLDFAGTLVYASGTSGFTPDAATQVADVIGNVAIIDADPDTQRFFRIAAYDTFGRTGLNISDEFTATTQPTLLQDLEIVFSGIDFQANATTNVVTWTTGLAIVREGGTEQSFTIAAGNASFTTATVYIYYVQGETILRSTTDLTVAVRQNQRIVAWYAGGARVSTDNGGGVIIDGDRITAGTVGASQLVVGTAVITQGAQIQNAIIGSAQIAQTIQSTNYDSGTNAGWILDKSGTFQGQGITIYNSAGQVIFSSGGTTLAAVTDSGAFAGLDQITAANVSTYIANVAIGSAQIGSLNADVIDAGTLNTSRLNIDGLTLTNDGGQLVVRDGGIVTAKIGANAVTNTGFNSDGSTSTINSTGITVTRGSVTVSGFDPAEHSVIVTMTANMRIIGGNADFTIRATNGTQNFLLANEASDTRSDGTTRQYEISADAEFTAGSGSFQGQFQVNAFGTGASLGIGVVTMTAILLKR